MTPREGVRDGEELGGDFGVLARAHVALVNADSILSLLFHRHRSALPDTLATECAVASVNAREAAKQVEASRIAMGYAHPAATAREEALAKCVAALDAMLCAHGEKSWSLKDPVNSFPGFPGHGGWGGAGVNTRTVAEAALAALALARSVNDEEA